MSNIVVTGQANLATIDQLEGALSSSHIQSIRHRVIEAGGDLQDYQDTLAWELEQSGHAIASHYDSVHGGN